MVFLKKTDLKNLFRGQTDGQSFKSLEPRNCSGLVFVTLIDEEIYNFVH